MISYLSMISNFSHRTQMTVRERSLFMAGGEGEGKNFTTYCRGGGQLFLAYFFGGAIFLRHYFVNFFLRK